MRPLLRRLPPLRWRDERIAVLRVQRDAAEKRLRDAAERDAEAAAERERVGTAHGASFQYLLEAERRLARLAEGSAAKPLRITLAGKLYSQSIARAAGVQVPEVYRVWHTLDEIDLGGLPSTFVLKSDRGTSSQGVFPLLAEGDSFRLAGHHTPLTAESVIDRLRARALAGKAPEPYFVEEYLHGRGGDEIPPDIKVYAFYGEIGHILLRQVGKHGDNRSVVFKYVDEDGANLGPLATDRRIDSSIPLPANLDEVVRAARAMSVAARVPFIRVDLYETDRGIFFGEYTTRPGGRQWYGDTHDARLGELWEAAQARLDADRAGGTPAEPATWTHGGVVP
ncbi:ATP-grasp fold amidoligase family protein [Oerskovia flava]|uniref:ATP-grasp fold amidoligase family protein n=1 Tax=Oerskovia flava TaxID=2986422 RepID=UPI00223EA728|nr:ATP-grasp fold amidoligase family protein [Oerskovia sp. JB1-3-2]